MNVFDAIKERKSVRKYAETKIPPEHVQKLMESARLAPSANNFQPWRFILVEETSTKQKLCEVCQRQKWMLEAPLLIVCVGDLSYRIKDTKNISIDEDSPEPEVKKIIRDTTIACEHIVLEAAELGLSTCWVAWFEQKDIRPVLNIPNDKFVVAVLTVGYGAETPKSRPRKSLDEIVCREMWEKD